MEFGSSEPPSRPWSWSVERWHRDFRYDVFRARGAGSEIGVSVRELSNDEQDVAAAAWRAAPEAVLDFRVVREKKETMLASRTAAEAKS
jgi:hypothetical protein